MTIVIQIQSRSLQWECSQRQVIQVFAGSIHIYDFQVINGIEKEVNSPYSSINSQIESSVHSEYYNYVRRLPPKRLCEVLFQYFFGGLNRFNAALDETIFRELLDRWWSLAHDTLLTQGPEKLPDELRLFPALAFQVLAVTLQFIPLTYDSKLDELKFGPSQTFTELSKEYTACGVALSSLFSKAKPTLVGVQQNFMRDWWLLTTGDLLQAWDHSHQTIK
jgi:hypothetical protein